MTENKRIFYFSVMAEGFIPLPEGKRAFDEETSTGEKIKENDKTLLYKIVRVTRLRRILDKSISRKLIKNGLIVK